MSRSRLDVQAAIDGERSALERNQMGQFATPPELAAAITREALRLRAPGPIRFLEPALGTGAFFEALLEAASQDRIERASGIELDARFADASRRLWAGTRLQVENADFTLSAPQGGARFNLVLTNPPYVRHHHLEPDHKAHLVRLSEGVVGRKVSGLSGLYVHFALLADRWLEDGAVCAWLIPSEFMDVNYGEALKSYLLGRVELLRVHRYCPSDVRFEDALVTSTVVFFRKSVPVPDHAVRFSSGPDLERPDWEAMIPAARLRTERKWGSILAGEVAQTGDEVRLGDLVTIRRGIATGANGFFVIPRARAEALEIPREFVRPVLPSPRRLTQGTVGRGPDGFPELEEPLALIDCREHEETLASRHPKFHGYLLEGKAKGVHEGYLARSRTPWYSQEHRPPPPLLCTYMGRSVAGRPPFRIIVNESDAVATNVYLLLYPKPWLQRVPDHARRLAELVRRVSLGAFANEGRVYGGGLQKMEPKELAHLPLDVPDDWKALMGGQPTLDL